MWTLQHQKHATYLIDSNPGIYKLRLYNCFSVTKPTNKQVNRNVIDIYFIYILLKESLTKILKCSVIQKCVKYINREIIPDKWIKKTLKKIGKCHGATMRY